MKKTSYMGKTGTELQKALTEKRVALRDELQGIPSEPKNALVHLATFGKGLFDIDPARFPRFHWRGQVFCQARAKNRPGGDDQEEAEGRKQ